LRAELRRDLREALGPAGDEHHPGAPGDQHAGDGEADAGGRPGDDGNMIAQVHDGPDDNQIAPARIAAD
jgi:hypothetical protein